MSDVDPRLARAASVRPARWKDLLRQFVGGQSSLDPVHVALVQNLRALESREVGPYQFFSSVSGNPTATQHWVYTFTPTIASRECRIRFCNMSVRPETATATIGVRVGAATAKAATNLVFPFGDALSGLWTIDQITAANVPLTLSHLFPAPLTTYAMSFPYPEYFLEFTIPPNNVLELISLVADDGFDLRLGSYTLPIV